VSAPILPALLGDVRLTMCGSKSLPHLLARLCPSVRERVRAMIEQRWREHQQRMETKR